MRVDQVYNTTVEETYQKIHKNIENTRKNLEEARHRQTFFTNQERTVVEYEIDQMVDLSTANLKMEQKRIAKHRYRGKGKFKSWNI